MSDQNTPDDGYERICFVLRIRPERAEEYKARHAAVWQEMRDALRETGWRNYSIFLREDGLLVGYVECEDFQASLDAMQERPINAKWQGEMNQYFEIEPGTAPDAAMNALEQVFFLA
jgi:L-rhamnose mutarotase